MSGDTIDGHDAPILRWLEHEKSKKVTYTTNPQFFDLYAGPRNTEICPKCLALSAIEIGCDENGEGERLLCSICHSIWSKSKTQQA